MPLNMFYSSEMVGSLIDTYKVVQTAKGSLRSLARHKLRSMLSVLGVICGVMALITMISIGEGAKREAIRRIEQLGIRNIYVKRLEQTKADLRRAVEKLSRGLTRQDAEVLQRECRDVVRACWLRELNVSIRGTFRPVWAKVVSCSAGYAPIHGLRLTWGRFITEMDRKAKNLVCVVGDDVAREIESGMVTGRYIQIGEYQFRIVGRLARRIEINAKGDLSIAFRDSNRMIFLPTGIAISGAGPAEPGGDIENGDRVTEITLEVDRTQHVMRVARLIKRILDLRHHGVIDYEMVVPLELIHHAARTKRLFQVVLAALASVSLLVGGIGIMNIMLATVSERKREIGIRRSLGATPADILFQFLLESTLLTAIGGGIGGIVGMAGLWLAKQWFDCPVVLTPLALGLPFVMSILAGLGFGTYPAYTAAKLSPIEALRHE